MKRLLIALTLLLLLCPPTFCATLVASVIGGNCTAGGTWVGGVAPTAADDTVLDATSGNVTLDSGCVFRSLDATSGVGGPYTGTLTHNAVTIVVGDATAGVGNVILKLSSGMTYTLASVTTSAFSLNSTSTTQQDFDPAGKTFGNTIINGGASGGNTRLVGTFVQDATATFTVTRGTFATNNNTMTVGLFASSNSNTRTVTLGSSTINVLGTGTAWNMQTATGLTLTANTATITLSGATVDWFGASKTWGGTTDFTGSGVATVNSADTFFNLYRHGTAAKTDQLQIAANITITGNWIFAGNSLINRLLVASTATGTQRTITLTGATVTGSYFSFADIKQTGANIDLSASTGYAGDCGGNTGFTFSAPITQLWPSTSGGNISTASWPTRVPMCQDYASFGVAFIAGQTITNDMPRLGTIDFTGATGTPALAMSLTGQKLFGSLILIPGMTMPSSAAITFAGRGTYAIDPQGHNFNVTVTIDAPTGLYQLLSDIRVTSGGLTLTRGQFDADIFNVRANKLTSNSGNTRTLSLGTGTWTLDGTSTVWDVGTSGQTFNAGTATIVINNTSSSSKTFAGAGLTYVGPISITAGGTGAVIITGSNTFGSFQINKPKTVTFTAGTTQTFTGILGCKGGAGNLITINSSTASSTATLSKSSGTFDCDYLTLTDSTASGGVSAFAGSHSTLLRTSGWSATDATPLGTKQEGKITKLIRFLLPQMAWASGSAPTANAGPDRVLNFPQDSLVLMGDGVDPERDELTVAWTQLTGPASVTIDNAAAFSPQLTFPIDGTYTFRLSVSDGTNPPVTDDVTVTVNPESALTKFYVDPTYTDAIHDGSVDHPWNQLGAGASGTGWPTINAALASNHVIIYFSARQSGSDVSESQTDHVSVNRTDLGNNYLILDGMSKYNTSDTASSSSTWVDHPQKSIRNCKLRTCFKIDHVDSGHSFSLGWASDDPSGFGTAFNHGKLPRITMRGFNLTDSCGPGSGFGCSGRSRWGGNFVTFEYNYIHDLHNTGANIQTHQCHKNPALASWGCLAMGDYMDTVAIHHNIIENGIGEGIYIACNYQGDNDQACSSKPDGHKNIFIGYNTITTPNLNPPNKKEGDGIDVKANNYNVTIRGNVLSNIQVEGITITGVYIATAPRDQRLLIERNSINGTGQDGMKLTNSLGAIVRNNIVVSKRSSNHNHIVTNVGTEGNQRVYIYNNTIYEPNPAMNAGLTINAVTTGRIENNLIVSTASTSISCTGGSSGITSDYNLHSPARSSISQCTDGGHSQIVTDSTSIFVNPGIGDFRPLLGCTACALGVNLTDHGFQDDYLGSARGATGAWTIGAYSTTVPPTGFILVPVIR